MVEDPTGLVCDVCLKPQSSVAGLKQHMRRIHKKVPLLPIQCNLCEKLLRDEHTLKCHIKAVHGCKTYSCPYEDCKKSFSSVGILNAHLKTHSDIKMYKCDVCGSRYKDKGYYVKHLNSHHNSKKPFECEICGKSYLQRSHLKDHLSLHTGEKRYKCEVCDKSFRQSNPYREHINSHNGIKLHKCSSCDYTTSYRKNLISHERKHKNYGANLLRYKNCECISQSEEHLEAHKRNSGSVACKQGFTQIDNPDTHTVVCKGQIDMCNETSIEIYEKQESPITILVNIPQDEIQQTSSLGTLDISNVVEIPCEIQTVQVETSQVSPFSLLLSAAASESLSYQKNFDQPLSHKFDRPEESTRPLDLSVSAQVTKNPENDILEFTSVNSGRRRSVFLVEELDYEHQGEMTVVDPLKVTGVNKDG